MFSTDSWRQYPQNVPKDLAPDQVRESGMFTSCAHSQLCSVYIVDVSDDGHCNKASAMDIAADNVNAQAFWKTLQQPLPDGVRIRAFFVENLSMSVLQMLGTAYKIEPSFFSSLTNWVPSRYQENVGHEDHITVVLPFVRTMQKPEASSSLGDSSNEAQDIDPQVPLDLIDGIVFQDLLAIHMVRSRTCNTIISCHPLPNSERTSGTHIQSFVQRTWDNMHRSKTFTNSKDPTYHFLAILYFAMYAWDEAFEAIHRYIDKLEYGVLETADIHPLACKRHEVQAHLSYYQQLLLEFHESVEFIKWLPNPVMEAETEREESTKFVKSEADKLSREIRQLRYQILMQSARLRNITELAFATIHHEDSRALQRLTKRSKHDMQLFAYFAMVFFPGIFMAKVFEMNVVEINPGSRETLRHFAEATVALTLVTAWLVIALQTYSSFWPPGSGLWRRLAWPMFYIAALTKRAYLTIARKL